MNEPSPAGHRRLGPGRWKIYVAQDGRMVSDLEPRLASDRVVEVVPVPDEQAIERGIEAGWRASSSESMTLREITNIARAVLAAALEQPE